MSENSKGLTYEEAHAAQPVGHIFSGRTVQNNLLHETMEHIVMGPPQKPEHIPVYRGDVVATLKGQISELEERLEGYKTALEGMKSKYEAERQRQFTEPGWFFPRVWITDADASTLDETIELTKRAPNVFVKLEGYGVNKDKQQFPAYWIKNGFYVEPAPMPGTSAAVIQQDDKVATLFDAIKHGDEAHQTWLKNAIDAHFAGQPIPEVVMKAESNDDQSWVVKLGAAVGRFHEPIVINGLKNEKLDEIYKRLMTQLGQPNSHSLLSALRQLVNEITYGSASLLDIVHLVTGDKTESQVFWGNKVEVPNDSPLVESVKYRDPGKVVPEQIGVCATQGSNCASQSAKIQTGIQLDAYIDYEKKLDEALDMWLEPSFFTSSTLDYMTKLRDQLKQHYLDKWLEENIPKVEKVEASRQGASLTTTLSTDNKSMLPKPVYSEAALTDPTNLQKATIMGMVGTPEQQAEAREFLAQYLAIVGNSRAAVDAYLKR